MTETDAAALERARTAERLAAGPRPDPQQVAKALVAEVYNREGESDPSPNPQPVVTADDVYVVTFAYVLGNWKAMLSSDAWDDTSYFEVTHDALKGETYVDHYRKVSNTHFEGGN